ncbi:MAG: DHH family phosphoesterase [Geminicoccaceae bacterium]
MKSPATLVERSFTGRRWFLQEPDPERTVRLSQRLHLPDIVARVLACRDLDQDEAKAFLDPRIRELLPDPSHLLGLDAAVERLAKAIRERSPIGIIGDYDVDGATSTALLVRYLQAFGCPFEVVIPDRLADGYGPNIRAVDRLADSGVGLLVTLDSGTTAHEALEHARTRGLDTVVVDHHLAENRLPPALAVVNPNRLDQESPLGGLAAVGVTFVLLVGLNRAASHGDVPDLMRWLDLVALGTVCDVVPLSGLNRALVRHGLKIAASGGVAGMGALARVAGIQRVSEAMQFGFAFGPRINAGGRLGRSDLGWKLLSTDDGDDAESIAIALDELNRKRQTLERDA